MSVQPIFAAYLRERARANKQESERERSKGQERVREREGRGGRVHNLEPQNAYFRSTHPNTHVLDANIHEETRVARAYIGNIFPIYTKKRAKYTRRNARRTSKYGCDARFFVYIWIWFNTSKYTHPNIQEETRVAPSSPLQGLGFRV